MDSASRRYRDNPSFSSSLLDEIYRSIDDQQSAVHRETLSKKQSKFGGAKSSSGCFANDHDERRTCLVQKLMENKKPVVGRRSAADLERSSIRSELDSIYFYSSSSSCDSSCGGGFSSSEGESMSGVLLNPKPILTGAGQQNESIKREKQRSMYGRDYHLEDSLQKDKHEGKFVKTKLKALKIYSDLKKAKQPISPGGRLSTFLNSLFTTGATKKPKTGSGAEAARSNSDRKSKSANPSTCSSASSFSRSCLSNTPSSRGKLSNGIRRSVRFYPVSVIVDEDCQPCGHKSLYKEEETDLETVNFAKNPINEKLKVNPSEKNRHIQEAARHLLNYQKKFEREFDSIANNNIDMNDGEDEYNDGMSESSSDLFELDNLSAIGMDKYREELPVYETTDLRTNRAIANGHFL